MSDLTLLPIKKKLTWTNAPVEWDVSRDGNLSITAGKATDLFVDPQGEHSAANSPRLMFEGDTVFQLSAKVEVSFRSDYDAGGLLLYQNDHLWAKLCFELSPQKNRQLYPWSIELYQMIVILPSLKTIMSFCV